LICWIRGTPMLWYKRNGRNAKQKINKIPPYVEYLSVVPPVYTLSLRGAFQSEQMML
jgi:hypothetical protein